MFGAEEKDLKLLILSEICLLPSDWAVFVQCQKTFRADRHRNIRTALASLGKKSKHERRTEDKKLQLYLEYISQNYLWLVN